MMSRDQFYDQDTADAFEGRIVPVNIRRDVKMMIEEMRCLMMRFTGYDPMQRVKDLWAVMDDFLPEFNFNIESAMISAHDQDTVLVMIITHRGDFLKRLWRLELSLDDDYYVRWRFDPASDTVTVH